MLDCFSRFRGNNKHHSSDTSVFSLVQSGTLMALCGSAAFLYDKSIFCLIQHEVHSRDFSVFSSIE